jgi:hypothetical protein
MFSVVFSSDGVIVVPRTGQGNKDWLVVGLGEIRAAITLEFAHPSTQHFSTV